MLIALFGATGRVGTRLLEYALAEHIEHRAVGGGAVAQAAVGHHQAQAQPGDEQAGHAGADESQRAAMDRATRTITGWANRAKEEMLAAFKKHPRISSGSVPRLQPTPTMRFLGRSHSVTG